MVVVLPWRLFGALVLNTTWTQRLRVAPVVASQERRGRELTETETAERAKAIVPVLAQDDGGGWQARTSGTGHMHRQLVAMEPAAMLAQPHGRLRHRRALA